MARLLGLPATKIPCSLCGESRLATLGAIMVRGSKAALLGTEDGVDLEAKARAPAKNAKFMARRRKDLATAGLPVGPKY